MSNMHKLLRSNGGPFALIPEKYLENWQGIDGSLFFNSEDETDYEVLCNLPFEHQGFSKLENIRCFSIFEASLCLETCIQNNTQFIVPGFTLYNNRTLLSCILDGTIELEKRTKIITFEAEGHAPLILFDGAFPGKGINEHSRLAENGDYVIHEFQVTADNFLFDVYKLIPAVG